jgi:hypothetical protein
MNRHASAADLQLYVIDALGPLPRQWLEAHVVDCDDCARSLGEEAALEETLRAAWPALRRPLAEVVPLRPAAPRREPRPQPAPEPTPQLVRQPVPRPARRSHRPGSGLAAAAVALLFLGWWADGSRAVAPATSAPLACLSPGFSMELMPSEPAGVCRSDDGEPLTCASGASVCALPSGE